MAVRQRHHPSAGSYIMLGGEKLTLLDPYEPEQKDEAEWSYRPKFQSHVMGWGKVPFFHYTYGADNAITARATRLDSYRYSVELHGLGM